MSYGLLFCTLCRKDVKMPHDCSPPMSNEEYTARAKKYGYEKTITCKYCDEDGLYWNDDYTRLEDYDGNTHNCRSY
jgi:hypothetical protein